MTGRQRFTLAVSAGLIAGAYGFGACGGEQNDGAASGGAGGMSNTTSSTAVVLPVTTATTTATTSSGGGTPPDAVPDGWVEWTGWTEGCPMFYPPTPDLLPDAIDWEPCPSAPVGASCLVMRTDWAEEGADTIALKPKFSLHNGTPQLMFRRILEPAWLEIVADVDGPVRNALMRVRSATETSSQVGCMEQLDDLNEGRWVLSMRGHDALGDSDRSEHRGGIGGTVGDLVPQVIAHYTDSLVYSFWVSDSWVLRVGVPGSEVHGFPWGGSPDTFIVAPPDDPENLKGGQFLMSGDTAFWSTAALTRMGINVWDPVNGARPFIRYVNDFTRGAADLGTDGTDLVWSYGEGKQPSEYVYPTRDMMTAPFTSDPNTLQPRRVRSVPYTNIGSHQWYVGCGYAAHEYGNGTFLVRLLDGVSWTIPAAPPEFWTSGPIGVSCDDVFILGRFDGPWSIARVAISSLGPGTPPD